MLHPGGQQRLRFSEASVPGEAAVDFPATESLLAKAFEAEARRSLVIAGLALERHRLRQGTWPASLASLDPGVSGEALLDPMDGGSLRYRRVSAGDGVCVTLTMLELVETLGWLRIARDFPRTAHLRHAAPMADYLSTRAGIPTGRLQNVRQLGTSSACATAQDWSLSPHSRKVAAAFSNQVPSARISSPL